MASSLLPPPPVAPAPEKEAPVSDHNGKGFDGGNIEFPGDDRRWDPDPVPERWATPLAAYRIAGRFIVISITSVFATLTHILESRWVHSKDWVPIALPHILYLNTAVLLVSSATIELARLAAKRQRGKTCATWLRITLLLGIVFVAGQLVAWRELVARRLYVGSNPGSFFFYFLTGAHAFHLLGGILALLYAILFAGRLARGERRQTAVGVVAFYWHFMDGLWLYLLALLSVTIQR